MIIEPFDIANIDKVATMAAKMWGPIIVPSIEFTREVLLNWFYDPKFSLQACDDDGTMHAIAFASMKNDVNISTKWIDDFLVGKSYDERRKVLASTSYLLRTEKDMLSMMDDNSAKFSLLISDKKGFGTPLLERLTQILIESGAKWIYLITDSTCNLQFHTRHGFKKIHEELVVPLCTKEKDYYCLIYRKQI